MAKDPITGKITRKHSGPPRATNVSFRGDHEYKQRMTRFAAKKGQHLADLMRQAWDATFGPDMEASEEDDAVYFTNRRTSTNGTERNGSTKHIAAIGGD